MRGACDRVWSVSLLSSMEHTEPAPPVAVPQDIACAICNVVIGGPKKYQIHKVDRGFTLGGIDYVLAPVLQGEHVGHACHKCYQANMKAKVRSLASSLH